MALKKRFEQRITDISGWLKKEYKKITGESIKLTKDGEVDVRVENSSKVRSWVVAKMHYRVGGLTEEMNDDNSGSTNPVEASWKKVFRSRWLEWRRRQAP